MREERRPAWELPRLYREFASWWHLLSRPEDYEEEAGIFRRTILEASATVPRTLLELGSGGGNNASHLKKQFEMTLVDLAHGMLEASRSLNPECEHIHGDMRTVRLGRVFDAVFLHDAVSYMTTREDLGRALETAAVHCRQGGVVLAVPDSVRETYRPRTKHGGHDGEGRAMRYLEWNWDPDPRDDTYLADFAYILRDEDGSVRVERDRHVLGLFPRQDWLDLMARAGLAARVLACEHSELEPGSWEMYLGLKQ